MNHDLKNQAIAIIQGRAADPDTKLNLLLGLSIDIQGTVNGHEERMDGHQERIEELEVYPHTVKNMARFLGWLGAAVTALVLIAGAYIAITQPLW